ncbi:hypothetical protein [Paraburkholderia sp. BCC1886]|uniref:hypothetical protein n=1 Tax=Paraburkholderia sp. BCC1886 TaxID=2562670 RepID=UPI001182D446|nr:hypothetical protein [Paraburkholderia sp. BCC1886]
MKIEQYLATILPSFKKDQILDDVRNTRVELREATLPAFEVAHGLLGHWKWKSGEVKDVASNFQRLVKGGNLVTVITEGLRDTVETLALAESFVMKSYNEEVVSQALTYQKANILQFIEAVAFVSRYSRKLLNFIFVNETRATAPDSVQKDALTPYEIKWIDDNLVTFCTAFAAVAQPVKKVEDAFDGIPEIVVKSSNADVLKAMAGGEKRLDPFRFGFIDAKMNLFYHVGKWLAEGQVERYNAAKEELRLVQLRKLNLEKIAEKKPDAALQQEIEYTESRVQGLNAKIAKMEAEYA